MMASLLNIVTAIFNNFVFLRAVALEVPKTELGEYLFLATLIGYIGLAQAGMDLAAAQRIADSIGKNDLQAANRTFFQLRIYNYAIGVFLASLAAAYAAWSFSEVGHISSRTSTALTIALTIIVKLLSNPQTAALSGGQHFHISSIAGLGNASVSVVAGYLLFQTGWGVISIALGQLLGGLSTYIYLKYQRAARCPWTLEKVDGWQLGSGALIRYGLLVSGVAAVNMIDASSDPILFWIFTDDSAAVTAEFNMWLRVPLLSIALLSILANNSTTLITAKLSENRKQGLYFHSKILQFSGCMGAFGLLGVAVWLTPFMHHWLNGQYDQHYGVLCSLALASMIFFKTVSYTGVFVFYSLQMGRLVLFTSMIQLLAKWSIAPWAISYEPVLGCAAASAFGTGVSFCFSIWRLNNLEDYPRSGFFTVASCGALALTAAVAVAPLAVNATMVQIMVGAFVTFALFGLPILWSFRRTKSKAF